MTNKHQIAGSIQALKASLKSGLKNRVGKGIDVVIGCDLKAALKEKYTYGFDLECLDVDDFQVGGFFNKEEAAELVEISSMEGISNIDELAHFLNYGF